LFLGLIARAWIGFMAMLTGSTSMCDVLLVRDRQLTFVRTADGPRAHEGMHYFCELVDHCDRATEPACD
jgi:hypothetical protein